jgi:hypothetical protein
MPDKQKPSATFSTTVVPPLPSAFTLYRSSIEALLCNIWTFVLLLVVPCIFAMSGSTVAYLADGKHASSHIMVTIGIGLIVFGIVLGIAVLPALLVAQIKSARGEIIEADEALRHGMHIFWRYFGLVICLTLIYIISFVALIVPFFFAIRRYLLAPYYLADHDIGISEALRRSAADSQYFARPIWGLAGVQVLNGMLASAPVIGWIVDALYYCAPAVRYQQIQDASKELAELNKKVTKQSTAKA